MWRISLAIISAYLLGAIPTSYIFGKILKGIDIRRYGSGNVGATNVFRVVGRVPGIIVLVLDTMKGVLAVCAIPAIFYSAEMPIGENLFKVLLAAAVISGHIWTVFLRFRGGKGVATSAGVLLGIAPKVIGLGMAIWILTLSLTRYVSLSSILASLSVPILMVLFKLPVEFTIFTIIFSLIIVFKHRTNIRRLLKGGEARIGSGQR